MKTEKIIIFILKIVYTSFGSWALKTHYSGCAVFTTRIFCFRLFFFYLKCYYLMFITRFQPRHKRVYVALLILLDGRMWMFYAVFNYSDTCIPRLVHCIDATAYIKFNYLIVAEIEAPTPAKKCLKKKTTQSTRYIERNYEVKKMFSIS